MKTYYSAFMSYINGDIFEGSGDDRLRIGEWLRKNSQLIKSSKGYYFVPNGSPTPRLDQIDNYRRATRYFEAL